MYFIFQKQFGQQSTEIAMDLFSIGANIFVEAFTDLKP